MTTDLKNLTLDELRTLAVGMDQKAFVARYIFAFIHRHGGSSIGEITPLSKAFRAALLRDYHISQLKPAGRLEDADGTVKYIWELPSGGRVESVALLDGNRRTLCISTQSGCSRQCRFCATGFLKFRGNLTAAEIVDQVIQAGADLGRISNIVYMGMGEPLDNYDNVARSVRILNAKEGLNIGLRRITISTCGIAAGIRRLADENLGARLAVSLHSTDDRTRSRIMPGIAKEKLAALAETVRYYQRKTGRRVTFEYVMIKGLNDSPSEARRLVKFLGAMKAHVNLIEYNPHPHSDFAAAERSAIRQFRDILAAAGIEAVIRFRRGQAIKAACGQLGADWHAA
jgi:23S rRNA (adenine2503-C2)-methyltransferase